MRCSWTVSPPHLPISPHISPYPPLISQAWGVRCSWIGSWLPPPRRPPNRSLIEACLQPAGCVAVGGGGAAVTSVGQCGDGVARCRREPFMAHAQRRATGYALRDVAPERGQVVWGVHYVSNKAGLTGQTVPGRRIPGHWPYLGPDELARDRTGFCLYGGLLPACNMELRGRVIRGGVWPP